MVKVASEIDNAENLPICGIIMPIASMPGYDEDHWSTVLNLLTRAIETAEMRAEPVWVNGAADVIQERIVRNLYDQPLAICDVSGLNPNVMLELGLRLAFGRPTILVTDEIVRPPFDIGSIEYVPYSKDLHILRTENFIQRLVDKIRAVNAQISDDVYKPFIKTFGPIEAGTPGQDAVPIGQAILDQLEHLGASVRRLESQSKGFDDWSLSSNTIAFGAPIQKSRSTSHLTYSMPIEAAQRAAEELKGLRGVAKVEIIDGAEGQALLIVLVKPAAGIASKQVALAAIDKVMQRFPDWLSV